ncbi:MAG: tyrosine-type recombinase/integrase [Peptococcaceae bacterium]|nr:tyrosine-type recombinase/integrase [Peptococcaceae bacterium]
MKLRKRAHCNQQPRQSDGKPVLLNRKKPERVRLRSEQKLTLEEAYQKFIQAHRDNNSRESTLDWFRVTLSPLFRWLKLEYGVQTITAVTEDQLRAYLRYSKNEKQNKASTINNKIRCFKLFFNFLVNEGYLKGSPAARIKEQKVTIPLIPTFTMDQLQRLLAQPDRTTFAGLRDYTMIQILMDTGMRIGELLNVTVHDLVYSGNDPVSIIVRHPKTREEREVTLPEQTSRVLREWLEICAENNINLTWLCPNIRNEKLDKSAFYDRLKKYGERAEIRGVRVSAHTFRHTFAKHFLMSGGDPLTLKDILGHRTLDMTYRYARLFKPDLRKKHNMFCPSAAMERERMRRLKRWESQYSNATLW